MGATAWSYFAPFQPDIGAVLEALRQDVFRRRDYERPYEFAAEMLHTQEGQSILSGLARVFGEKLVEQARRRAETPAPLDPNSIEELIEQCAESGTHSLLDIDRIATTPEPSAASPLSSERLKELFDTDQPTRPMVEDVERSGLMTCRRGQAHYLVVYEEGKPSEVYFWGSTGD